MPVFSKAEFISESRFDIFLKAPRTDSPVDTRYLEDIKNSLMVPLFGKLSIGPTIELVFFRAKNSLQSTGVFHGNYYFSYSTALQLNYSFEWHNGMNWRKVAYNGNPESAPQPLPSR